MLGVRERTELGQYFAIKTDLAAAVRGAVQDDIDFHRDELTVMQMHTTSDKLRRACRASLVNYSILPAASVTV